MKKIKVRFANLYKVTYSNSFGTFYRIFDVNCVVDSYENYGEEKLRIQEHLQVMACKKMCKAFGDKFISAEPLSSHGCTNA